MVIRWELGSPVGIVELLLCPSVFHITDLTRRHGRYRIVFDVTCFVICVDFQSNVSFSQQCCIIARFSPFSTISLYRAVQYLSHPVFSVLCHVFMSPCMLCLHLFLGRPLFSVLLPENSNRSDFAQMWLGSRLTQWPNHFSLLFSRKVSTGFTWASFLVSSFLMCYNLVFPLAQLNILSSYGQK